MGREQIHLSVSFSSIIKNIQKQSGFSPTQLVFWISRKKHRLLLNPHPYGPTRIHNDRINDHRATCPKNDRYVGRVAHLTPLRGAIIKNPITHLKGHS